MDWSIKNNRKHLLLLLVFGGLIPHVGLCLLQIASASESWAPVEIQSYSNFLVCEWVPFCLALFAYLRLQKRDTFSLLPAIAAAVVILSFLPRFEQRSVWTVMRTIPLMLAMELSALLKKGQTSGNKFVAGLAADRKLLRSFCFWTLGFICVAFISCDASTFYITMVSPFLLLPIPGILLFDVFRRQTEQPPTIWGFLGMLVMMLPALYLVTIGPMEQFKIYHLMSLGAGFVILLLLLIVYNLDHWRKPAGKNT